MFGPQTNGIHHRQNFLKGNTPNGCPSGRGKVIPDESLDLQGGVKSKESKHVGSSTLVSSAQYNNNNVLRGLVYTTTKAYRSGEGYKWNLLRSLHGPGSRQKYQLTSDLI